MWFVPKIFRGRKSYQIFTIFAEQMEPVIILFSDAFRQCCNCSNWGRVNKTLCVETRRIFVVKKFQGKEWTWHGSHPTNSRNSRILSHSFIWKQNRPKWQSSSKARLQGKGIIIQNKTKTDIRISFVCSPLVAFIDIFPFTRTNNFYHILQRKLS